MTKEDEGRTLSRRAVIAGTAVGAAMLGGASEARSSPDRPPARLELPEGGSRLQEWQGMAADPATASGDELITFARASV